MTVDARACVRAGDTFITDASNSFLNDTNPARSGGGGRARAKLINERI